MSLKSATRMSTASGAIPTAATNGEGWNVEVALAASKQHRDNGNTYYRAGNTNQAIEEYTEAVNVLQLPSLFTPHVPLTPPVAPHLTALTSELTSTYDIHEYKDAVSASEPTNGSSNLSSNIWNQDIRTSAALAYNNRCAAYLKASQYKEAAIDATYTVFLVGNDAKACFRRATALFSLKEFDAAYKDALLCLSFDKSNHEATALLRQIREAREGKVGASSVPVAMPGILGSGAPTSTKESRPLGTVSDILVFLSTTLETTTATAAALPLGQLTPVLTSVSQLITGNAINSRIFLEGFGASLLLKCLYSTTRGLPSGSTEEKEAQSVRELVSAELHRFFGYVASNSDAAVKWRNEFTRGAVEATQSAPIEQGAAMENLLTLNPTLETLARSTADFLQLGLSKNEFADVGRYSFNAGVVTLCKLLQTELAAQGESCLRRRGPTEAHIRLALPRWLVTTVEAWARYSVASIPDGLRQMASGIEASSLQLQNVIRATASITEGSPGNEELLDILISSGMLKGVLSAACCIEIDAKGKALCAGARRVAIGCLTAFCRSLASCCPRGNAEAGRDKLRKATSAVCGLYVESMANSFPLSGARNSPMPVSCDWKADTDMARVVSWLYSLLLVEPAVAGWFAAEPGVIPCVFILSGAAETGWQLLACDVIAALASTEEGRTLISSYHERLAPQVISSDPTVLQRFNPITLLSRLSDSPNAAVRSGAAITLAKLTGVSKVCSRTSAVIHVSIMKCLAQF